MKFNKDLKNIVIGLDFDGTCVQHEFPIVGKDIGAIPVVKRLIKEFDVKIVLNTMRDGKYLEDAVDWFKKNSIPLYGINVNPEQLKWTKSPKVYADLYIDDLNLGVPLIYPKDKNAKPYVDWNAIEKMLFDKDEFKHILDKEIKKIHFKTK